MRELTKSVLSFSWAMSLFGFDRAVGLLNPRQGAETGSFDKVTQTMQGQLGRLTEPTFRAGDNLQRTMVDMMFGVMPGGTGCSGCGGSASQAASAASAATAAASAATSAASGAAAGAGAAGSQLLGLGIEMLQQGINVISRLSGLGAQQGPSGWGPVPPPPV